MLTLGVVVFSLQGMKHLSECLESVRWADEVLVLHAGDGEWKSTVGGVRARKSIRVRSLADATQHCREMKTDWVLHLWGEERVGEDLREELRTLCYAGSAGPVAYRIPVRSYLLGRWAEGSVSGPSPSLRLVRGGGEITPGWWRKEQSVPRLRQGWIGDYALSELSHAADYVHGLSDFWAESLRAMVSPPGPTGAVLCSLRVFAEMTVCSRLLTSGIAGLTVSALASYAVLLSGAKLWEAKHVVDRRRV